MCTKIVLVIKNKESQQKLLPREELGFGEQCPILPVHQIFRKEQVRNRINVSKRSDPSSNEKCFT